MVIACLKEKLTINNHVFTQIVLFSEYFLNTFKKKLLLKNSEESRILNFQDSLWDHEDQNFG
jgi:hypothetical protein